MPHAEELYGSKNHPPRKNTCQHHYQEISYPQGHRKVRCRDCGATLLSHDPKSGSQVWQVKP